MRTTLTAALAAAGLLATSTLVTPAFAADPTGLWLTPTRSGQVEISKCGNGLCGRLVSSEGLKADPALKDVNNSNAGLRGRALKGLTILTGFSGGPQEWTGGSIYNAEDGKTYSGTITMDGDNTLKLRGCVVVPLCKTQVWTRLR
ncbi:uncharacterized protein (DUF2147 family) [Xanthobacter flavus]|uniref:Sn-glycerol-3-phosphate ABC transporter ATP-binding protein n=1 Tax=Xanthobacter flavus TaxID=281 RepID=A0A9W6CKB0_XANFL|nr:DUF2147 domain-containing protein [Xanthobacter flavus]MDR6331962.1 uncharacterized protein (DUF2147 family) [Xanthobacter flavus]GLI22294.1 sn-glycerol-3-phosphate ABC transporter ATP-binding protein [Xanthobacter flavus]